MRRRDFIGAAAGSALLPRLLAGKDLPKDIRITRIVGFDLRLRQAKPIGKNAQRDHGQTAVDRMVRVYTNAGIDGLGNCRADKKQLAALLGKRLLDLYKPSERRVAAGLGAATMPLWDLVGKALGRPAYQLLGGRGPRRVPVYDGSIYFADLIPEYAPRWRDRFKREIDMGVARGHRAFKVKIGRGHKWMKRAEGDARDVEVIQVIRKHGGKDILIGVDANNGCDLAGAKRFILAAGDQHIAFAEEMFPERVADCLEFKAFLAANKLKTLVADGESQRDLAAFKPFIKAKALDILQGDMNRFGFEGILAEADMARPQGIQVAPHNWASLVGFYMQLQVGRAVTNFYRAEHDALLTDLLTADGYAIKDGAVTVPDTPGVSLKLNEKRFKNAKIRFDLKWDG